MSNLFVEHYPVLYEEVIGFLQPMAGRKYIDGTVGAGGHSFGILQTSLPNGQLLAFDRDPEAILYARKQLIMFKDRVTFVNENFASMEKIAPLHGFARVDGILLDLGLSSRQLDNAGRGFAFRLPGPLDMRFNQTEGQSAAQLINTLKESELADIFWQFGEERRSRRIAKAIVAVRPLTKTSELAALIEKAVGRQGRKHPATKVFQALRIAVNQELDALKIGLNGALSLLKKGGRLAIISFHSLEDRYVKHKFRHLSKDCICPPEQPICTCNKKATVKILTKRVVKSSQKEIDQNPRSRSARLRVIEKR